MLCIAGAEVATEGGDLEDVVKERDWVVELEVGLLEESGKSEALPAASAGGSGRGLGLAHDPGHVPGNLGQDE